MYQTLSTIGIDIKTFHKAKETWEYDLLLPDKGENFWGSAWVLGPDICIVV